jgi:hypothetical protein
MKGNHFGTLFNCVLASFAFMVLAAAARAYGIGLQPWVPLVLAVLPLVYYHVLYLRPLAKAGLSQAAIDSVYYFGFLVTVAALGVSAVSVAVAPAAVNVETIVFQFGVGLFATGYAIVARMHLGSISAIEGSSPEVIMDRYVKRSLALVDNVETAAVRWSQFSEVMTAQTMSISETARTSAEKAMLEVARIFENEMKSTLALGREGLSEIRSLVSDISFASERKALQQTIKATLEACTELNKALQDFAERSREGAQVAQGTTVSAANLNTALAALHANVTELGGKNGAFAEAVTGLNLASAAIQAETAAVEHTLQKMHDIAEATAEAGASFKSMRSVAKKAAEQINALAIASESLADATTMIQATADASGSVAQEMTKMAAVLPPLVEGAEALTTRLERTSKAAETLEKNLVAMPALGASWETLGSNITATLKRISDAAGLAAADSTKLHAASDETLKRLTPLSNVATTLQETVATLNQLLSHLANSIAETQQVLNASSSDMKNSISVSAQLLEADVKRSAEAVGLLTERLTQVAQYIVDQTRKQQALRA